MARYTTLSPTELARIVSQYPIGTPLKLEEIPGGFGNSNFKLTTTAGEFLLKICDEKDPAELNMQIELLQHLHQYAYPDGIPYPNERPEIPHPRDIRQRNALSFPARGTTAILTGYAGTTR